MTDVDLVMKRLVEADPAPDDDAIPHGLSSSVLFDEIRERSGEMNPSTVTHSGSRGPIVAIAVFLVIVGAGAVIYFSVDSGSQPDMAAVSPTTATTLTDVTTPIAEQPTQPHEYALGLWEARYGPGSDPTGWLGFLGDESPARAPIEWDWLDDFDGDGVVAFADWMQFQIALNPATRNVGEYECETVAPDTARCVVSSTDAFYELAGVETPATQLLMTFEAGLLVSEETIEPDDPDAHEQLDAVAEGGRYRALLAYEAWVNQTYPDLYPGLFLEPCCEALWVTLPEAVATHERLMAEYLSTVTTNEATTGTAYGVEIAQVDPEEVGNPFVASGSAVDEGLLCAAGTTEMFNYLYSPAEQAETWDEVLTCADGSGTIRIQYSASFLTIGEKVKYSGGWKVTEGSGAYDTLTGSGGISNGDDYEGPFLYSGEIVVDS